MPPPSPAQLDRCRQILEFWHGVEFFLPFDLQGQVLDAASPDRKVVTLWSAQALARLGAGTGSLWQVPALKPDRRITGFSLFLGVFDRSAMDEAAAMVEGRALSGAERLDELERLQESKGATCFAKVRIDASGVPNLTEISVSTLPWALGRLRQSGTGGLSFESYRASIEGLKARLHNFGQARGSRDTGDGALTGEDILALQRLFHDWAGFEPAPVEGCCVAIEARLAEIRKKKHGASPQRLEVAEPETAAGALLDREDSPQGGEEAGDDGVESPPSDEDGEVEVEILNSFYGSDIEAILARLPEIGAPLAAYLLPHGSAAVTDLAEPEAQETVAAALHPGRLPAGHWFDDPGRSMSLLQQFAINAGLATSGLFSVNGPPGTGKTTLLRDIFAEIVTRRAQVLACLAYPDDAFEGSVTVAFNRGEPKTLSRLKAELTGFEMVVASSNNTAVNNISQDLPKAEALGPADGIWRDGSRPQPRYLQEVAHKIAAQAGEAEFLALEPGEVPWGLISCALGKAGNREAFIRGFRREPALAKGKPPPAHFDPFLHKSLWQWRWGYRGPGFAEAKRIFARALAKVEQLRAELGAQADAVRRRDGTSSREKRSGCEARLRRYERETSGWQQARAALQARLEAGEHDITRLREIVALREAARPRFWRRLRRAPPDLRASQLALAEALEAQAGLRAQLAEAEAGHRRASEQVHRQARRLAEIDAAIGEAGGPFGEAGFPPAAEALLGAEWQLRGVWHHDGFDLARSELFQAALGLHEAWLAAVLDRDGGLRQNIFAACDLLQGTRPVQREHEKLIWQSFFLVVPVVSTTFASVRSQFNGLGQGDIGWLFIDEAGQAPPQAAVGALWRAKRAIVVGDPLQIEPVFTVPTRLVRALAASRGLAEADEVSPQAASVQTLADAGNPTGSRAPGPKPDRTVWVGSPLRVHRRCAEPMFGLANHIAYGGRMIFGRHAAAPAGSIDLGPSAWVEVRGAAQDRQMVPEEIEVAAAALQALAGRLGRLPPLYLLSPFRRIKQALHERLRDQERWLAAAGPGFVPKAGELKDWCDDHVGTVHTFQGKEQELVWMVLGCDDRSLGAAKWASSKPNLLNVALTRAKARFFMIGKPDLWGALPHFALARAELPLIGADRFIARCRGDSASPQATIPHLLAELPGGGAQRTNP